MIYKPWWEIYPSRFNDELNALKRAGINYSKDDEAFAKGVLCLNVTMDGLGRLRVVFPDLYPYFRFEIYAPDLDLPHHQNPIDKNLCMIGRRTENWNVNDRLSDFLVERLPQVLKTGQSDSCEEVSGLEQQQADPISDFYSYLPGTSVIVDGDWEIDNCYQSGKLLIGIAAFDAKIKGALLEVQDEHNNVIAKSDSRIIRAFSTGELHARWVRLAEPLDTINQKDQFDYLNEKDPYPEKLKGCRVNGGILKIRAGFFPEENRQWRQLNYGWIFVSSLKRRKSWEINQIKRES